MKTKEFLQPNPTARAKMAAVKGTFFCISIFFKWTFCTKMPAVAQQESASWVVKPKQLPTLNQRVPSGRQCWHTGANWAKNPFSVRWTKFCPAIGDWRYRLAAALRRKPIDSRGISAGCDSSPTAFFNETYFLFSLQCCLLSLMTIS